MQHGNLEIGSLAQIAAAVASLAACLVAIWGPQIRFRLAKPRLRLALNNPDGVDVLRDKDGASVVSNRWYHLSVSNATRWNAVENVRVYLLRVERIRENGVDYWDHFVPLTFRHEKRFELGNSRKIGHAVEVDLCSIRQGSALVLATAFNTSHGMPASFSGPVHLAVYVEARGVEGDSGPMKIDIRWDGEWPKDRSVMGRHVQITTTPFETWK